MRKMWLIGLLGLISPTFAQIPCAKIADNRAHVCGVAPETMTNGMPIVNAITYKIQVLAPGSTTWTTVADNLTAPDWTSGVLTPGTYKYRMSAIVNTVQSDYREGVPGKVVPVPTPNPPASVIVAEVIFKVPFAPALSGNSPGIIRGLAEVGSPCVGRVVYTYRGRAYRRPSKWIPMEGVPTTAFVVVPCVRS